MNENKKDNIIMGLLVIIIILLIVLIGYLLLGVKKDDKKDNKPNNNINNNVVEDNNQNIEEQQMVNKNKNYEIEDYSDDTKKHYLELSLNNGVLKVLINNKDIKIEGLSGKILNYFYEDSYAGLVVITDDGEYMTFIYNILASNEEEDYISNITKITFNKIKNNTGYKIVDLKEYIPSDKFTDGPSINLGAVLSNGEIRDIGNGKEIANEDFSNNIENIRSLILHKDKTLHYTANKDKNIKYNNTDLKIDKLYFISNDGSTTTADSYVNYCYVISNNKLYKIKLVFPFINDKNRDDFNTTYTITPVNDKTVQSTSTNEKGLSEFESDNFHTETITYTDGTKETIKNIESIYIY